MASLVWLLVGILTCASLGCATTQKGLVRATAFATGGLVKIKQVRRPPRFSYLKQITSTIPQPSQRTARLLRKLDLAEQYDENPDSVIDRLLTLTQSRPTKMAEIHGLAEIAELQARWSDMNGNRQRATRLYTTAVFQAYQFFSDPKFDSSRNIYDPQFREICNIYNRSLEGLLRQVIDEEELQQGQTIQVGSGQQRIAVEIRIEGRWRNQKFARFEFVSDYDASGFDNQYRTYGLGVPMIAVRQQQSHPSKFEKYYPPEISIPMTAVMHWRSDEPGSDDRRAILVLHDPLEQTLVQTGSQMVPLESDITTPLAYGLRDPFFNNEVLATASLLDAEYSPPSNGLFMLEPFNPNKIPIVMVHGFWSSPMTWVHMFNDLRANRNIRENCQFWFYSYPTGQPFWISAQQLRRDLAEIRSDLDPRREAMPLDQMVMVGHSMGGLMSMMQTIDSGDEFWNIISEHSIDSLTGDPETISLLRDTFYFRPNHSIDRVITLATPFRGSDFSNQTTRWVSKKLFTLSTTNDFQELAKRNEDKLNDASFLTTATSIDSMTPGHPVFAALAAARQSPSVKMHNIIGRLVKESLLKPSAKDKTRDSDGVVSIESATNDRALTEEYVPVEHSDIHQHRSSINEVRRILLKHLVEHDRIQARQISDIPDLREVTPPEPVSGISQLTPMFPSGNRNYDASPRR